MCNGISIGLGFEGTEIAAPSSSDIEAVSAAAPNPCAERPHGQGRLGGAREGDRRGA